MYRGKESCAFSSTVGVAVDVSRRWGQQRNSGSARLPIHAISNKGMSSGLEGFSVSSPHLYSECMWKVSLRLLIFVVSWFIISFTVVIVFPIA